MNLEDTYTHWMGPKVPQVRRLSVLKVRIDTAVQFYCDDESYNRKCDAEVCEILRDTEHAKSCKYNTVIGRSSSLPKTDILYCNDQTCDAEVCEILRDTEQAKSCEYETTSAATIRRSSYLPKEDILYCNDQAYNDACDTEVCEILRDTEQAKSCEYETTTTSTAIGISSSLHKYLFYCNDQAYNDAFDEEVRQMMQMKETVKPVFTPNGEVQSVHRVVTNGCDLPYVGGSCGDVKPDKPNNAWEVFDDEVAVVPKTFASQEVQMKAFGQVQEEIVDEAEVAGPTNPQGKRKKKGMRSKVGKSKVGKFLRRVRDFVRGASKPLPDGQ